MDNEATLRYAKESLDQIQEAYNNGEYEDYRAYQRDLKATEAVIARLERKQ